MVGVVVEFQVVVAGTADTLVTRKYPHTSVGTLPGNSMQTKLEWTEIEFLVRVII